MAHPRDADSARAGSRCILWHAPGAQPPRELVERLSRRNVRIEQCSNPYLATASACDVNRRNARLLRRESENPGGTAGAAASVTSARTDAVEPVVLILVDPFRLLLAHSVVEAVHRYAPGVACWWYDPLAEPRLRPVTEADALTWSAPPGISAARPHLPADEPVAQPGNGLKEGKVPMESPSPLSRAELEALIVVRTGRQGLSTVAPGQERTPSDAEPLPGNPMQTPPPHGSPGSVG